VMYGNNHSGFTMSIKLECRLQYENDV